MSLGNDIEWVFSEFNKICRTSLIGVLKWRMQDSFYQTTYQCAWIKLRRLSTCFSIDASHVLLNKCNIKILNINGHTSL